MDEAFKAQLHEVMPSLRGYALSLTKSAADADDMVQEALLRAWRSRHTYREEQRFQAWIYRILLNVVRTTSKQRRSWVDLDSPAALAVGSEPDQEWRAQYAEMLAALERLNPMAREALLMVVAGGLSYEDAADAVGVPVGTMKSRVARARDTLVALADTGLVDRPTTAERRRRRAAPAPEIEATVSETKVVSLRGQGGAAAAAIAAI